MHRTPLRFLVLTILALATAPAQHATDLSYVVVDTAQDQCFDDHRRIAPPPRGAAFAGQDAQVKGPVPLYRDHHDGTVSDEITGLMWTRELTRKLTWDKAMTSPGSIAVGGHHDWRVPTIKELYSLIRFTGIDPDPRSASIAALTPYLDTTVFAFRYGDPTDGDRIIDTQFWSSTAYVATTMDGNRTAFGVNFADGRIKGYGVDPHGPPGHQRTKTAWVRYVRGNPRYGINDFHDNRDGTISDHATGLMWTTADSGTALDWKTALRFAADLRTAGHQDWRLPNAKELQSLVDYTRSPDTSHSAAIDPLFSVTPITNEGGKPDFPGYWTSTTHSCGPRNGMAVYVAFGRALGWMHMPPQGGEMRLLDVHGAGAQRCDHKSGDPADFPRGLGPQGDVMRCRHFVRCVRTETTP